MKPAPARFADAAVIAFQFGHAMLTLVIAGRAFMPLMQEAPSLAAESPVLIQYNDPEYSGPRTGPEAAGCEVFLTRGNPEFVRQCPGTNGMRSRSAAPPAPPAAPRPGLAPPRRLSAGTGQRAGHCDAETPGLSLDPAAVPVQRLKLPLDAICHGRSPMSAFGRSGRRRSETPAACFGPARIQTISRMSARPGELA